MGRPPPRRPRLTSAVTCIVRRAGLLRRHADRGRRAARRRRRLPLPRGARRADARDPAEGPPARRDARLHARPARVPRARAAVRRRRPHEGHHERGRHQPDRGRARRDRDRAATRASPGIKIATVLGDDLLDPARRRCTPTTARRSRTSTPATPFDELPGAAAVRGRVPRRAPDRRRARAGRRHRDHRPRRRRVAVPRAARRTSTAGRWDDWDRLAAGILVGHLLECSGQSLGRQLLAATGGRSPHPWDLPYPIAEVDADGTAVITKPTASGRPGRAPTRCATSCSTRCTTRRAYLSPDVVADFTSRALRGPRPTTACASPACAARPATDTYKLLLAYHAGWAGEARVAFSWPDAYEKAKATAAILAQAGRDGGPRGRRVARRVLGRRRARRADGAARDAAHEPPECVLRVAWRCDDQRTAGLVGRELVPLTLSAPPAGMTGIGPRRPARARPSCSAIWPTLVDKALVDPRRHA